MQLLWLTEVIVVVGVEWHRKSPGRETDHNKKKKKLHASYTNITRKASHVKSFTPNAREEEEEQGTKFEKEKIQSGKVLETDITSFPSKRERERVV